VEASGRGFSWLCGANRRYATIPPPWGLLTLGLLTLLPGDALCRLFFAVPCRATPPTRCLSLLPAEAIFLRFFGGALFVGWWALVLAEAGLFGAIRVLLGVAVGSVTLYALVWRVRGRMAFPRPDFRPGLAGAALVALVLLAGGLTFGRPFETVVGGEDAGVYFNSGATIARTGGIRFHDPGMDEFGPDAAANAWTSAARHVLTPAPANPPPGDASPRRYLFLDWQRLNGFFLVQGAGNTITPQFLHLFPVWLALWATFGGGIGAMVYGPAAAALLGLAATTLLARRLFGAAVGLLAGLLLALNGIQLWFARQTLSEALLQALLMGGIYAWAIFVDARRAGDRATARGGATLAAGALGSVALTHAQFVFALLPVAALLAWLWLARRGDRRYWWFFAPLAILLAHASFHIARYSLGYFEGIYHHVWKNAVRDWRQTIALVLVPLIGLLVVGLRPIRARWLPLVVAPRTLRLARRLGAAGALAIGAWLYLVRPGIIRPGNLGALSGYIGAPVPGGPASALVTLGWYLSPLGMLLAGLGLALLILRDVEERAAALFCLAAPFALLYLTGSYTQGGYIYSLRRFMPIVLPLLAILSAYAALRLGPVLAAAIRRPHLTRPLGALGVASVAGLVLFLGYTNARLIAHREYAGVLDATAALAARFGPDDIVLFSGKRDETPKLATPLEYLFGRESWTITTTNPDGAKLDAWIAAQEAAGRHVHILMSAGGGKLLLPHHQFVATDRVVLPLLQFEKLENQKPYNQQCNVLGYTVYELRPIAAGGNALGDLPYRVAAGQGDERALLGATTSGDAGFYDVECDPPAATCDPAAPSPGVTPYRWTDGEALVRVPWPADGRPLTLHLTLSAGPRPATLSPAQVVVGIRPTPAFADQEQQLGVLTIGDEWATYSVTIPANALPRTDDGTALIHLAVPRTADGKSILGAIWKPVDYPAQTNNSADPRDLHVRFAGLELTVAP